MLDNSVVNTRFLCDGYKGTVRWAGEVAGTEGIWLGVEWDDPNRGKHDGTHQNIKYFTTKHPKSGSFLRAKKADFGSSFSDALREKYKNLKGRNFQANTEYLEDLRKNMNAPFVELVGLEDVKGIKEELDLLLHLQVESCLINGEPENSDLSLKAPKVKSIDLTDNLLPSWDHVANITKHFPKLYKLTLSENRLILPSDIKKISPYFEGITSMTLVKCDIDAEYLATIVPLWPKVENLIIAYNNITNINIPPLVHLQSLDLEGNHIGEWKEIAKLGKLPQLKDLNISQCKIPQISITENDKVFSQLVKLTVRENLLKDWGSINSLFWLPSLQHLVITNNPIMKEKHTEDFTVAKLKSLKTINRSIVDEEERKNAEIFYWKKFSSDYLETKNLLEFEAHHPSYAELVTKYGKPEKTSYTGLKSNISIIFVHKNLHPPVEKVKAVPSNLKVGKLKVLLRRLFSLKCSKLNLTREIKKGMLLPMDDDFKDLTAYDVEENDKIYIECE